MPWRSGKLSPQISRRINSDTDRLHKNVTYKFEYSLTEVVLGFRSAEGSVKKQKQLPVSKIQYLYVQMHV